jgi:hypothetical protein
MQGISGSQGKETVKTRRLRARAMFAQRFTHAMTVKMLSEPPTSLAQRAPLPPADISGWREVGEPSKPQNALIMNSSPLQLAAASLPWTLTTRMIDPDVPGVPGSPLAPS